MKLSALLTIWLTLVAHPSPPYNKETNISVPYTEAKKKEKYQWDIVPSVRVCANTRVSQGRLNRALNYWQKLGYKFDHINYSSPEPCAEPYFGEILIRLPDETFEFGTELAATRIIVNNSNKRIVKAKIFIFPKSATKERVIEHEIGHAIGWHHFSEPYHIMNRNWHSGGYGSRGLRVFYLYNLSID